MNAIDTSGLREQGLLPHQVEFIGGALEQRPRGRVILADAVGLGKTRAAAALVQLVSRDPRAGRVLVVARAALLLQWHELLEALGLEDVLVVNAATLRRLEAQSDADENPWEQVHVALTSIDFLVRADRIEEVSALEWDLVIFDDTGIGESGNRRAAAFLELWESERVDLLVAVSPHPHTGDAGEFERLLRQSPLVLRRSASDVVDWDGQPLLRDLQRDVQVVEVELSDGEHAVLESVRAEASAGGGSDKAASRFRGLAMMKAAGSSLFALEQLLRRALVDAAPLGGSSLAPEVSEFDAAVGDHVALHGEPDRSWTAEVLAQLEALEDDSKLGAAITVLRRGLGTSAAHAVVFCDFGDTADLLAAALEHVADSVFEISGRTALAERSRTVEDFERAGGVLVLTSAAAEGVSLSFVKFCLHYDLPWNPAVLERRIGRVERFGASGTVSHVFLVDDVCSPAFIVDRIVGSTGGASLVDSILEDLLQSD